MASLHFLIDFFQKHFLFLVARCQSTYCIGLSHPCLVCQVGLHTISFIFVYWINTNIPSGVVLIFKDTLVASFILHIYLLFSKELVVIVKGKNTMHP